MKFARDETIKRLEKAGWLRRNVQALVIAICAYFVITSMWNRDVYRNAGLNTERALAEAKENQHHKSMIRSSCSGLMDFLASAKLLTRPAAAVYRRANLL